MTSASLPLEALKARRGIYPAAAGIGQASRSNAIHRIELPWRFVLVWRFDIIIHSATALSVNTVTVAPLGKDAALPVRSQACCRVAWSQANAEGVSLRLAPTRVPANQASGQAMRPVKMRIVASHGIQ